MPIPASSVWKDDEDCRLAGGQPTDQLVLDHDLRVAGEGMAAQEWCMAHVLTIDLQAEPGRQQHAQGCKDPENSLAVREPLEVDRQSDVVAILGRYALDQSAHFGFRTGRRRTADDLPVTELSLDFSIDRLLGMSCPDLQWRQSVSQRQRESAKSSVAKFSTSGCLFVAVLLRCWSTVPPIFAD